MPRRKKQDADAAPQKDETVTAAVAEPTTETVNTEARRPDWIDGPPTDATGQIVSGPTSRQDDNGQVETHGKNWGPPYKAIFTCSAKGFEMGENRRFKQRVFKFKDKPDAETLAALKDSGFTYRPEEKAWTIPADEATRLLTDRLAIRFAGESPALTK